MTRYGERKLALVPFVIALTLAATACSGSGNRSTATPPPLEITAVQATIISSDVAVGSNRFLVGLMNQDNQIITDADVRLRFYRLRGEQSEPRFETPTEVMLMTRGIVLEKPDGKRALVTGGETAAYVAEARFDEAGEWGVAVFPTVGARTFDPIGLRFEVREKSRSPAIGDPAPRSRQLTLADVRDLSAICTSATPDPEWHQTTIAQALAIGSPVAIAFTTPGFCKSQMCAPMTEELAALKSKYGKQVIFIHVEPYQLDKERAGEGQFPVPTMEEWGLETEPWIFIVDANGTVVAKFEAFVMAHEIEMALQSALAR